MGHYQMAHITLIDLLIDLKDLLIDLKKDLLLPFLTFLFDAS